MDGAFEKLGSLVRSCHLKDVHLLSGYTFQLKEVPCGEGELEMEYYASLAHRLSPDMPMLIEHLKSEEQYKNSLRYARERLRDYL